MGQLGTGHANDRALERLPAKAVVISPEKDSVHVLGPEAGMDEGSWHHASEQGFQIRFLGPAELAAFPSDDPCAWHAVSFPILTSALPRRSRRLPR